MDVVLRAAAMYLFLVVLFRLAGKRTLAEVTPFDLVLILIIAEAVGPAMLDDESSFTTAVIVVTTLIGMEIVFGVLSAHLPKFERAVNGRPVVLVDNGRPLRDRMRRLRVDDVAIMEAARELQGLERLDQVKYAILERSGKITVVPAEGAG